MATDDPFFLARRTAGMGLSDHAAQPDMRRLRAYRLGRLQAELQRRDIGAAVLYDPINIRYACGSRNMAVWALHNASRYCFVPAEGRCVLFDYHGTEHLAAGLETLAAVRPAVSLLFLTTAGERVEDRAPRWAAEIAELARAAAGGNRRIAFDRIEPLGLHAMTSQGFAVLDAQEPCELARAIKSADEIALMGHAVAVCDAAMARMREALRPGVTENELWAVLNETNARLGGEWLETRLLSSGGRTNPWYQEASDRIVRPGDLVSFDTDMIGPFGYCADLSRTFFCGPGKPSAAQRRLYGLAMEQIHHNLELVRPGVSLREFSEKAWPIPASFRRNRYSCVAHGVGLADEWPFVVHADLYTPAPREPALEPGMTICVESYMGEEGGTEGVKLEQQVLVTETGCQIMSTFPFEEALAG